MAASLASSMAIDQVSVVATEGVQATVATEGVQAKQTVMLVFDESGSMLQMGEEPIQAACVIIKEQATIDPEGRVKIVMFNDTHRTVYDGPIGLADLNYSDFKPNGLTALHDAIGETITAEPEIENVICIVATDGMENASSEKFRNKITPLIKEAREKRGWRFVFIGANQDSIEVGGQMGVVADACANFSQDVRGDMVQLAREVSGGIRDFRSATIGLSRGQSQNVEIHLPARDHASAAAAHMPPSVPTLSRGYACNGLRRSVGGLAT